MLQESKQSGFTLVEIMVAISIFAIVATIAVSALLSANAVNQKAQAIKLAMDNLNYAVDSITFKMKRGTNFSVTGNSPDQILKFDSPKNDPTKTKTSYAYRRTPSCTVNCHLEMSDDGGASYNSITMPDIDIKKIDFTASDPANGPSRATIMIQGAARVGHEEETFALETAVTERL